MNDRTSLSNPAELARIFNTALVTSQIETPAKDHSAEIFQLVETPAFKAILSAVRQLACQEELTERQAAERVIGTFRKMDAIWSEYIRQEGIRSLK